MCVLRRERDAWKKCAEKLAMSVEHIGTVSVGEGTVIMRAERALSDFKALKERIKIYNYEGVSNE
jgi:hypothetical protein